MFVSNHQACGPSKRSASEQPLKSPANSDRRVAQVRDRVHSNTPSRPGAQTQQPHYNERPAQEEQTGMQRPGATDKRPAPLGARPEVMHSFLDPEASMQRRPALKSPAHTTPPCAFAEPSSRHHHPVAAAQAAGKSAKPPSKSSSAAGKVAATSVAKVSVKPAVKAPAKAPAKPAPAKVSAKAAAKPVKALPQPAVKAKPAPAKPSVKSSAQATAQAAPKPAAPKSVEVKAAVAVAAPVSQVPVPAPEPIVRKTRGRSGANAMPAPAPVVPTHAPDAAKASYMQAHERAVAPPPQVVVIRKDPKLANNWKNKPPEQLSDEEVIAMPDTEYMNDVQLAFFRLKLTKLKQDIHNNAGETTEHLREDTVVVPDPADRATIEEEHALELRTRDRERKLLKKIEQSIHRIDSGDYGFCDETGEAIGVGRLIARPTASLSLEAQQRRELKQKMFGD